MLNLILVLCMKGARCRTRHNAEGCRILLPKAAEQGVVDASSTLTYVCRWKGVGQDYQDAAKWFRRAEHREMRSVQSSCYV